MELPLIFLIRPTSLRPEENCALLKRHTPAAGLQLACTRIRCDPPHNEAASRALKSLKEQSDRPVVGPDQSGTGHGGSSVTTNQVQRFRENLMMSKAELARKAGLSTLTIDRVEAGRPCRLDTKRKILLALGLKVSDKDRVFGSLDEQEAGAQSIDSGLSGYRQ
ncbi:MAG: helix-turn-helix transcriptional regulator [Myxococcota bacterium]